MVFFNGEYLNQPEILISSEDRGLGYGDGLFETLYWTGKKINWLEYHKKRINAGCQILNLEDPFKDDFSLQDIVDKLLGLKASKPAKVKLRIWRKESPGYGSTRKDVNLLLQTEPRKGIEITPIKNYGLHPDQKLFFSTLSAHKTLNALPYVIAGNYQLSQKLDVCLLQSHDNSIAEAVSSNIFLLKDSRWITPPLKTGCLNGTRRQVILEKLDTLLGYPIKEKRIYPLDLDGNNSWFIINALSSKIYIGKDLHSKDLQKYKTLKNSILNILT